MGRKKQKKDSEEAVRGRKSSVPRWSMLEQPRIQGFATNEWNVVEGTVWYSPEWGEISQSDDYDCAKPNNLEWWARRVHPEDMPTFLQAGFAVHVGIVDSFEVMLRMKHLDGAWRQMLFRSLVSEKSEDGSPLLVQGICIDLTDVIAKGFKVPGGNSLTEADYHSMLENSPDMFIRFSRDMSLVYANPAVARYLGRVRENFLRAGKPRDMRIILDYKALFQNSVERVFAERAVVRQDVCLDTPHAGEICGECSFWPEFGPEGGVRYAMMQFRDRTAQRRMEQRVKLNEQRLEALYRLTCMENASESEVLNFVLDSVLSLTRSRSAFFFIPESENSTRGYLLWSADHHGSLDRLHLPDDHLPQDLLVQMQDSQGNRRLRGINNGDGVTPLYVAFDGKMKVMRSITAPGMEGNRLVCIAGVCNKDSDYEETDLMQLETFINSAWLILRRRRSVQELREAKEAAEAANSAKNAFLANVSHELRTPLHGVLSMLQLIDPRLGEEQQREYLRTARASGKALLRIISDILDFSSMESGRMPLNSEVFDFAETMKSALGLFAENASAKGLEFVFTVDPGIPRRLLGDEDRLRQIVFNIVGNAFKFTPEGRVSVDCARVAKSQPGKAGVSIVVADTGLGIPGDKLESIFEAFTQIRSSDRKNPGTGLGLSIVKHLVAMMNGTVSVESEVGGGTTVRCVLHFAIPERGRRASRAKKAAPQKAPVRFLDILVAEDDSVGSFALRVFLERQGHRVVCVEDGRQALEALQMHDFDCLFTDIEMPRMDGLELVRHIRADALENFPPSEAIRAKVQEKFPHTVCAVRSVDPEITVVAVSAHTMIGDRERFLRQGINYYISKPIIKGSLNEVLNYVARRVQARVAEQR